MRSYLDTNVVLWLFAGNLDKISSGARKRIESDDLFISPAVMLELEYLFEIEKVAYDAEAIITDLSERIGLRVCQLPFATVAVAATRLKWTRDPFDRLIAAHAEAAGKANLLSADRKIREQYSKAIW